MTYNLTDPTKTLDYVPVEVGLVIWNYNLDLDRVVQFDYESHGQRWWRTERGLFDASRMWVRHPETNQRADEALALMTRYTVDRQGRGDFRQIVETGDE